VLRAVTAGLFNIVRSFLALLLRSRGKGDAELIAAGAAADGVARAIDAAATAADTAVVATADDAAATGAAVVVTAADAATASDAPAIITAGAAAAAPGPDRSTKPQGRKVMSSGFDMQAGIARLAKRIMEPVAAKLTAQELEQVLGLIRAAFEQFNAGHPAPEPDFANMAAIIIEPVQASLTDVERRRVSDRLNGAMAAFCQGVGQRAA
jgi:hypothetical protein